MTPSRWTRSSAVGPAGEAAATETWTATDRSGQSRSFPVRVRFGKPFGAFALKSGVLASFGKILDQRRNQCRELYAQALEEVSSCPVCGVPGERNECEMRVYGVAYNACRECRHRYVVRRPTVSVLREFYARQGAIPAGYADRDKAEQRLKDVALPKAEWLLDQYRRIHGRAPKTLVDVGAGGGHFVQACRQLGIDAAGVELSESSRDFCRLQFGFDLIADDFVRSRDRWSGVDVVTFWGVIEHSPDPLAFLSAARNTVSPAGGLVVAAVPRWDCFGTFVQSVFRDTIIRHLDPTGHLHVFSDESLATAFARAQLRPESVWYYGMDVYELASQLAYHFQNADILRTFEENLNQSQSHMDRSRFSDEMVMAGTPESVEGSR